MKRFLLRTFLGSLALFAMSSLTALAVSTYTIDTSTYTVGTDPGTIEIEYTADTANQTWADGDTLTVTLPDPFADWSSLTFTAEYDEDTTNDGTDETAITVGAGNGQYAISGKTITIKWDVSTWGAVSSGASTIRIIITAGATPDFGDDSSSYTLTFAGATANGGDSNPGGSNPSLTVNPADANGSVSLNPPAAGTTTATITFTIPTDLIADDYATFIFPENFDISSATFSSDTFDGDGAFSCSASSTREIACTTDDAITAGTGTIVLEGVSALYPTDAQNMTYFEVYCDSCGGQRATDSTASVSAVAGSEDSEEGIGCGSGLVPNDEGTACVAIGDDDDDDSTVGDDDDDDSTVGDDDDDDSTVGDDDDDDSTVGDDDDDDDDSTEQEEEVSFSDIAGHWAESIILAMAKAEIVFGNPDGTFAPDNNIDRASAAALIFRILGFDEDTYEALAERPFTDVETDAWYSIYVSALKEIGVVNGSNGAFMPAKNITRAEFIQMAMSAYLYTLDDEAKAEIQAKIDSDPTSTFTDLDKDAWYAGVISAAQSIGMIEGRTCGTSKCAAADATLTRAEAATILYNFFMVQ